MYRKQRVRAILILFMLLATGVGILFLSDSVWRKVTAAYLVQQAKDLWVNATMNFSTNLLQNILIALIITILALFSKKIWVLGRDLFKTEEEKLTLKDLKALEAAYLVDLKCRIIDDTDKNDRWNIKRYIDMDFIAGDETEPELREFRVRVWKQPAQTPDPVKQYLIYGEPSKHRGAKLSDYMQQERRLVIKGEPGSGKTITLRRLATTSLENCRHEPTQPLPILIDLGQYRSVDPATQKPIEVLDFLKIYLKEIHPDATFLYEDLEKTLQRRTVLFLFDGLNEMPPQDYLERVRKLAYFSQQRRKDRFVFACRTLHYDPLLEAKTLTIMPLDDNRMRLFLQNYLENAGQADRVLNELRLAPPQMLEACRTPLILFMLSRALAFQPDRPIPSDPVAIFDGFVSQLYVDNKLPEDQRDRLSRALSEIAFFMVKDRMISAAVDNTWLSSYLPGDSVSAIHSYGEKSGVLDYSVQHGYKFSHHMLQEFFAGWRLAESFNRHEDVEPYLSAFWWEEVVVAASALVESPDDFLAAVLGETNDSVLNHILQEAFESPEGKKNLDVLKYLCQRAAHDSTYQKHVSISIGEFYQRVFQAGRARVTGSHLQDRRLLLAARIIGAIYAPLSAGVVNGVAQCLESRLVFGDTYQRAGIIEVCRYLEEKEGIGLLSRVISPRGDGNPFREFQPTDPDEVETSLFSFFCAINLQRRLPILNERRWLRELAFVTLASIETDRARSELAQLLLADPSVWSFISGAIPVLSMADLMQIVRQISGEKHIRNGLIWLLFLASAVILTAIVGVSTVIGFLLVLSPLLWIIGLIYYIIKAIRNIGRLRVQQPTPNRRPASRQSMSTNSSFTRKDLVNFLKTLSFISLGIIGIGVVILIGLLPVIALAIFGFAFWVFLPLVKTYLHFISNQAAREELSSRIFTSQVRTKLIEGAIYLVLIPMFAVLVAYPEVIIPPTWIWGQVGNWIMYQFALTSTQMVSTIAWIASAFLLLYFPPVGFSLYSIVGSYLQLIDIHRLRSSLMQNQSEQNYRRIDERLMQIVVAPRRWNVARSRAIQALSHSPFANDHLPLFEKLNEQNSDVPILVQEAAERAIYEIKRRETKYSDLLNRTYANRRETHQPTVTSRGSKPEREPMPASLLLDQRMDFVIVTALAEERDAILDKLPGYRQLRPSEDDIRTYFQAEVVVNFPDDSTGTYHVILLPLLGMGRVQAAIATADAIRQWHPRYILLVGIAGGMATRGVRVGDILISDQIVDYEQQKLTPQGPEVRWDVQRADPRLLNVCNNFRGEGWQELIRVKRPGRGKLKRHTGPIASGDKVVAFGEILARYGDVWPKLIGVEMEAAGVATAAFQSPERPGFFMVRGVSDLADENKGSVDVEKWRSYACDAVASFVIALLKSGPVHLFKESELKDSN